MTKPTVIQPQRIVAVDSVSLFSELRELIGTARQRVATVANAEQTLLYWRLGKRISTKVLGGDRAIYGGQIVVTVSRQLEEAAGSTSRGVGGSSICQTYSQTPKVMR